MPPSGSPGGHATIGRSTQPVRAVVQAKQVIVDGVADVAAIVDQRGASAGIDLAREQVKGMLRRYRIGLHQGVIDGAVPAERFDSVGSGLLIWSRGNTGETD